MKEEKLYLIELNEDYSVPKLQQSKVKEIAEIAYINYEERKIAKEKETSCYRTLNAFKATCASNLKKKIIKEYRLLLIYSMLDNLQDDKAIPIKALNDFSRKYFNSTINNNEIHKITTSEEYKHLFIKNFNKRKTYQFAFDLSPEDEINISKNKKLCIECALEIFNNKNKKGE